MAELISTTLDGYMESSIEDGDMFYSLMEDFNREMNGVIVKCMKDVFEDVGNKMKPLVEDVFFKVIKEIINKRENSKKGKK